MDWISIIGAAVCGGLAGAVASVALRYRPMGRAGHAVIFAVTFIALNALSMEFIIPAYRSHALERSLLDLPAYREIAIAEPEAYSRIITTLKSGIRDQGSLPRAVAQSRSIVGEVAMKHLPQASNGTVTSYVAIMVDELEQLARADPELCYAFLFPQAGVAPNFGRHIEETTQRRDLEQLATLIRSARTAPQPLPSSDEAEPLLERVRARLAQDFGDDVDLLNQSSHSRGDWPKVCDLARAFYKQIGSLPGDQGGVAFRYMTGSP
jgi:hypothetical protein